MRCLVNDRSVKDLLPFFREGGDGVNAWLLRYLCERRRPVAP
jgi:hypothetical protein